MICHSRFEASLFVSGHSSATWNEIKKCCQSLEF